jgi:hypothetical protein
MFSIIWHHELVALISKQYDINTDIMYFLKLKNGTIKICYEDKSITQELEDGYTRPMWRVLKQFSSKQFQQFVRELCEIKSKDKIELQFSDKDIHGNQQLCKILIRYVK